MKKKVELLSPAGNLEKLYFAYLYGADGAYIGGKIFNLRARADNFSLAELKKGIQLSKKFNKNLYLTLNIFFKNSDFKRLGTYLEQILKIGVKNIIISDLGVLFFIHKNFKNEFNISISTQTNVMNSYFINILTQYNVKRIILARELTLNEIKQIKEKTNIEIETFIHGAMCVSYSGRCLLSEYMTERNANLGDCAQPCRWNYFLMEQTREGEYFPIFENKYGTTILSSKDLCTLPILHKLINAKIDSFKIEGRMKSLYYVANVTRVYRFAIDNILKNKKINTPLLYNELESVSHRPYFTGFFEKNKKTITYDKSYIRNYQFIGYLKRKVKDTLYEIVLKSKLEKNRKIEIILPDMQNIKIKNYTIYNKNFKQTDMAKINEKFYISIENQKLENGIIREDLG